MPDESRQRVLTGDAVAPTGAWSETGVRPRIEELEDACEAVERLLEEAHARPSETTCVTCSRLDEALRTWARLVERRALALRDRARLDARAAGPWDVLEPGSPLHAGSLLRAIERLMGASWSRDGASAIGWGQSAREIEQLVHLSIVELQDP